MAARARGIEQTPESTFLIPELATAFPDSHFLHLLRDGRDVVSSLMERGWLAGSTRQQLTVGSACGEAVDEAGHPFGAYARFWVESDRRLEFEMASEARRCAWAWRRYVSTALDGLAALDARRVTTIRYEELVREPTRIAEELAIDLGALGSREEFVRALSGAHSRSVGNFRETLTPEQLDEVTLEAGALLSKLGYLAEGGTTE
jgi:hypothetical protein